MKLYHTLLFIITVSITTEVLAQVKIGDNPTSIGTSSILELESTDKAFVLPRVANTSAITVTVNGMMIYDNSADCIKSYRNGQWSGCLTDGSEFVELGSILSLDCAGATASPADIIVSEAYSGTLTIPYTGADGGFYNAESVSSTGVTGLTASLVSGSYNFGEGTVNYELSGTPTSAGTASFALSLGGQSCSVSITVITTPTYQVLIHDQSGINYPGGLNMPNLDDKLLNAVNFGNGGTYNANAVITYTSALTIPHEITAPVLAAYDVYIISDQSNTQITSSEAVIIKYWVDNEGGVLIELGEFDFSNNSRYYPTAPTFGNSISSSSSSSSSTVSLTTHPLFDGPFGILGPSLTTSLTGIYDVAASGFTLLAYSASTSKPIIYSYDSGSAIFIGDEVFLRTGSSTGSGIGTGQADKLWGNIMAWAFDQVP